MKLACCWIWTSPFVWTRSVGSMLSLRYPEGVEVGWFQGTGWCPAARHINACRRAVEWDADLICILGADQVYEPDLLERLVSRFNEGYEVVAAFVPCRGYVGWQGMKPFQPMAWRFKSSDKPVIRQYRGQELDGDMMEIVGKTGEMERINFIGSGVLMFHREHLLALDEPWFFETVDVKTQQRTACMDSKFVWRLQREGHATVWVDPTINVKHIHPFEIDDTFQDRFLDWMETGKGDPSICRYEKPKE